MRIKRLAALSLAAVLTAGMLTGCPWDKEADETDDASSVPVTSTDTSQPGSDDEDDDTGNTGDTGGEDTETPDDPNKPTVTLKNNELTVAGGDGALTTDALKELLPEGTNKAMIATLDLSNSGYTSIGVSTFSECTSLTSIGNGAFVSCTGLTSIRVGTGIIGDGMTIGVNAFGGVPNTVMVYYPKEWENDGNLEKLKAMLVYAGLNTGNYTPYEEDTKMLQASPEVPDSAKKLLDAVRVFGM